MRAAPSPLWACYAPDAITIHEAAERGPALRQRIARAMSPDRRYFLRLRRAGGALMLRSAEGGRAVIEAARGEGPLGALSHAPERPLGVEHVFLLPDGRVAALDPPRHLFLWSRDAAAERHELPEGFAARAVCAGPDGALLVAGAASTGPLLYRREGSGPGWCEEPVRSSLGLRVRGLTHGDVEGYSAIHEANGWLVLGAEAPEGDPGEADTLLWLRGPGPGASWRSAVLKDDVLRGVLPCGPGGCQIISHFGALLGVGGPGERLRRGSLLPRLRRVLGALPPAPRFEVLDAQPGGILVVSMRGSGPRLGEAVVALGERECDDRLVAHHGPSDPEIITAC